MLHAVQNNLIDTHDEPFFVNDLTARIVQTGGAVSDNEILQGLATGKIKRETVKGLVELRDIVQGGNGSMVKNAYAALNEMFRKSMMADGTPEQAAAHLAAPTSVARGILMRHRNPAIAKNWSA